MSKKNIKTHIIIFLVYSLGVAFLSFIIVRFFWAFAEGWARAEGSDGKFVTETFKTGVQVTWYIFRHLITPFLIIHACVIAYDIFFAKSNKNKNKKKIK